MNTSKCIATVFGIGLLPKMPGTWASIATLPVAWLIAQHFSNLGLMVFSGIVFAIGVVACNAYTKATGKQDPPEAVIDEVAGQCFLLATMPVSIKAYLIGLVLFRLFDIVKPFPVSYIERNVKGGLSVMLDDMFAAAYPPFIFVLVIAISGLSGHPLDIGGIYEWLARDVF